MLSDFGFKTITANDGKEALAVFRQKHREISFVLMDLTMPHMDGEEAFREFRRIDPEVKVIICSGYNEQEVSQKFVGKGLAGFLKKPFQLSQLQKKIQVILKD
jgi:CheY-like chemotaxis protein